MLYKIDDYLEVLYNRIKQNNRFTFDDVKDLNDPSQKIFSKPEEEIILCIVGY